MSTQTINISLPKELVQKVDSAAKAVSGKVDYIVTADKDLLVLEKHRKVAIISPKEFAAMSGMME